MKRLGCLFAVILLVLVSLVAFLPASMIWDKWLEQEITQLELKGLSGPWWRGNVAAAKFNGIALGKLNWSVFPKPIEFQLEAEGLEVQARALDGQHSPPGITFEPLTGVVDFSLVPKILSDIDWQGQAQLDFDRFELIKNQLLSIDGKALWENARLSGNISLVLGEVEMQFKPHGNSTLIELHSVTGPDVNLDGAVLLAVDSYQVDLRLRAKPGRTDLQQQLLLLGKPNADGSVLLNFVGSF